MLKKLKRLQKPSKTLKRPSKENQLSILYRSNKAKISLLHITHNLKRPSKPYLCKTYINQFGISTSAS